MSAAGQLMDPVAALAAQNPAPITQAANDDPVAMLAAGNAVSAPASTPTPGWHGPAWADPKGYLSTVVRNFSNGAAFNLADPVVAATGALFPVKGYTSTKPTYGQRFDEDLAVLRGATAQGEKSHPLVALGSSVAGGMANPVARALPAGKSLGGAILQGAGLGAGYGAGGSIGNSKDLTDAAEQTGFGALTGGLTGALGKLLAGGTRTPPAQLLHDEGVPLTIGESAGGTTQTLEDASTHIPMMGNAIKGRQADAITGFNRAFYNRVLEPIGIKYTQDGPVGNEGIAKIGSLIGDAYDKAYEGATIVGSPTFHNNLSSVVDEASNSLPKEAVTQLSKNINRLLVSKQDSNGIISTDAIQTAKNWFAEQSRVGPTASLEDRALAKAYGGIVDAIKQGIKETDPARGALLDAADASYARLVPVQQAAGLNQASGKGGIFTASQIGQALRSTDNSVRRSAFAKGIRLMQDLAQAGQQVLPSTVPDSGTALRGLLELGAGGAITHEISPDAALAGAGLIGTGTALYSKPGQKLANALIYGAPGARKAMAAIPKAMIPGFVAALQAPGIGGKP